jgi:uncharacterized protein (DUF362 family)
MKKTDTDTGLSRRDFLKTSGAIAAGLGLGLMLPKSSPLFGQSISEGSTPAQTAGVLNHLAAVRNGEPHTMFDKGIEALGGMGRFVSRGDVVLIKPNASFNSDPDRGATTNPLLVKRVIEHCFEAGASKVYAIDHTLTSNAYSGSGIKRAVEDAGGSMVEIESNSGYGKVEVPGGKRLKEVEVHELVAEADKLINIPILKNHGSTGISCAIKNLMGLVWDRSYYHRNNLDQCIADFALYRMPDLTIVDAYYVMVDGGPRGRNSSRILNPKMQFLSHDIVTADSAALAQAKQLGVRGTDRVEYINRAFENRLGIQDLRTINIARLSV